jgi:hypothetical protein
MDEPSDGLAPAADLIGEAIAGMKAERLTLVDVEQDLHLAFRVAEETAVWTRARWFVGPARGVPQRQLRRTPPPRSGAAPPRGRSEAVVLLVDVAAALLVTGSEIGSARRGVVGARVRRGTLASRSIAGLVGFVWQFGFARPRPPVLMLADVP